MAYATKEDVAKEFVNITFDSTGKVKDTDVDSWIAEEEAFANGKIGLKYVTPVTGTESLLIMKKITVMLVAHKVRFKLDVKTINEQLDQGGITDLRSQAIKMLEKISLGKHLLPDAALRSTNDGVSSFTVKAGEKNFFKKGVDQW